MSQKNLFLPRVRLYSDNERDQEILAWLERLPNGFKGDGIKDAMWASIKGLELPKSSPKRFNESPPPSYETRVPRNGSMLASVSFDTHELLADIRQIVEVGVAQALAHHSPNAKPAELLAAGSDIEAMLDSLDMNFILDDDEDE